MRALLNQWNALTSACNTGGRRAVDPSGQHPLSTTTVALSAIPTRPDPSSLCEGLAGETTPEILLNNADRWLYYEACLLNSEGVVISVDFSDTLDAVPGSARGWGQETITFLLLGTHMVVQEVPHSVHKQTIVGVRDTAIRITRYIY